MNLRIGILAAALIAAALLGPAPVPVHAGGDDDAFVTGIDGLPLMPGLVENAEEGMVFDTPAGRIVEAYASGSVARERVIEFYASTLPQLGWRRDSETAFSREDELLSLELNAGQTQQSPPPTVTVRFSLSPAGAPRP